MQLIYNYKKLNDVKKRKQNEIRPCQPLQNHFLMYKGPGRIVLFAN